ncbi:hypothetical protein BG015_008816 [Linnemannia schmuckeri]|uniref:Uncharacterized protein n=1 Tax=Linnemannia schmuckeri TaxID=64567 RepID=A0A9P5RZ38_9FUNG|nr:hypothetical protein BG015_008816 [Linnemannia schmuckeri]
MSDKKPTTMTGKRATTVTATNNMTTPTTTSTTTTAASSPTTTVTPSPTTNTAPSTTPSTKEDSVVDLLHTRIANQNNALRLLTEQVFAMATRLDDTVSQNQARHDALVLQFTTQLEDLDRQYKAQIDSMARQYRAQVEDLAWQLNTQRDDTAQDMNAIHRRLYRLDKNRISQMLSNGNDGSNGDSIEETSNHHNNSAVHRMDVYDVEQRLDYGSRRMDDLEVLIDNVVTRMRRMEDEEKLDIARRSQARDDYYVRENELIARHMDEVVVGHIEVEEEFMDAVEHFAAEDQMEERHHVKYHRVNETTRKPVKAPAKAPVKTPAKAPVRAPVKAPAKTPPLPVATRKNKDRGKRKSLDYENYVAVSDISGPDSDYYDNNDDDDDYKALSDEEYKEEGDEESGGERWDMDGRESDGGNYGVGYKDAGEGYEGEGDGGDFAFDADQPRTSIFSERVYNELLDEVATLYYQPPPEELVGLERTWRLHTAVSSSLEDLWQRWMISEQDRPSVWCAAATMAKRLRKNFNLTEQSAYYIQRRIISNVFKHLQIIGREGTLAERVAKALTLVKKEIDDVGSLYKYSRPPTKKSKGYAGSYAAVMAAKKRKSKPPKKIYRRSE